MQAVFFHEKKETKKKRHIQPTNALLAVFIVILIQKFCFSNRKKSDCAVIINAK